MRIGIDARMYGPGQGGLGRYVEQLIKYLEQVDRSNDYVIFLRAENWESYQPQNPRFKKVLANIPWYGLLEQTRLPRIIRKQKVDLMHFPHWNVPLLYRRPFIVTIHDLILLHYPTRRASTLGPLKYLIKNLAWRSILRHAVKDSQKIITPSEFTKKDLITTLDAPAEKISVTPLAPYLTDAGSRADLNAKYGITKPYLLYVGVAFPHKNLEGLLLAWNIFQEKYSRDYQLVLVGKKNYFYRRLIDDAAKKQIKNIIFTDFVPDYDLPALYQNAALYVFPSFYEGFGLPPLEAMSFGIPVVSSATFCLPEILRDAALYFDPHVPANMARLINSALTDQNLRSNLIKNAQNLLTRYSWKNTAEKTFTVYQNSV